MIGNGLLPHVNGQDHRNNGGAEKHAAGTHGGNHARGGARMPGSDTSHDGGHVGSRKQPYAQPQQHQDDDNEGKRCASIDDHGDGKGQGA